MPLNTAQKQQVTQFQSFTGTDKKTAEKQLRSYGWEIQRAVDKYVLVFGRVSDFVTCL